MSPEDLDKLQKRVEKSILELTRLFGEIVAYCDELARGQGWDEDRIREARRVAKRRANMVMSAVEREAKLTKPQDRS